MNPPTRTLGALVLAAIVVSGCGLRDRLDGPTDGASIATPAEAAPMPSSVPTDPTGTPGPADASPSIGPVASASPTATPTPLATATPRATASPVAVALPVSEVDDLEQLLAEIDAQLAADADAAINEGSTP